jgi:hypothetical protein
VSSLWIVGALMLLLGLFSATPSMRRGPDELMNVAIGRRFRTHHPADRDSGLGLSVILAVGGLSICAIALVVG